MKGIAHFISGVAAASFIPAAVASAEEGSLVLALAGACALLPDTLDFKVFRYLKRFCQPAKCPHPLYIAHKQFSVCLPLPMLPGRSASQ